MRNLFCIFLLIITKVSLGSDCKNSFDSEDKINNVLVDDSSSKFQNLHSIELDLYGTYFTGAGLNYRFKRDQLNFYLVSGTGIGYGMGARSSLTFKDYLHFGYKFNKTHSIEIGVGLTANINPKGSKSSKAARRLFFDSNLESSVVYDPKVEMIWDVCLRYNYRIKWISFGFSLYGLYSYFYTKDKMILPYAGLNICVKLK